jgi:tetratricopeptide (TPR) repeat protein
MFRLALIVSLLIPALALADAAELTAKIDELYAKRDDPAVAKELEVATTDSLKAAGADYGVVWRAARWKFWLADGATDNRLKKQLGKEAWDLGERALKLNPSAVEGHYFAALGMGCYSQAIGILKALGEGIEGKFNERLDAAIKMNEGYDRGGPRLTKGRYFFELPWPKRDLDKSKEELEKCVAKHPENLRALLFLAETQLKDGDAKKAKETIAKATSGSIAYDPPEGRRVQKEAKLVADKIEQELK